jgi:HSP20 family molecular chaperone IbpA
VIAIFLPAITALVLVIVRRVSAIAAGVFDLVTVTRSRGRLRRARSLYATGTISLVFGVLVIAWPGAGALALVWMIGAYAIFSGALLHLLTDLIRDPFGGLGRWNSGSAISIPAGFSRAFDVVDDGDALRILAELPGPSRDDVKLEVIDDMLVLSDNKQIDKGEEKGCYRLERAFGQFQRAISLRSGVDFDRVDTHFDNGVLTLRVPEAGETRQTAKQIEIR